MALEVKLQVFEGPLDLLLHLIDKNKVDIYDIPIVVITEQYLQYIRDMHTQDMNVMSEFLVMAATLIDIKCKMLLPREVDETGEEEDPRAELVQRLIEYKMYKYMSYELRDRQMDAEKSWYKEPTLPQEVLDYKPPVNYSELLGGMTLSGLNQLFENMLKRQKDKIDPVRSNFGKIEKDEINIEETENYIAEYVSSHKHFAFTELLQKGTKMEIIVTFMALLEFMKTGKVLIEQLDTCGEILITSNITFEESAS